MLKICLSIIALASAQPALADVTALAPATYSQMLDEENKQFLKQLIAKVREAGFRDAKPVPQIFLVKANDTQGRPVVLLVNSDTHQAVEISGVPPALIETAPETSLVR